MSDEETEKRIAALEAEINALKAKEARRETAAEGNIKPLGDGGGGGHSNRVMDAMMRSSMPNNVTKDMVDAWDPGIQDDIRRTWWQGNVMTKNEERERKYDAMDKWLTELAEKFVQARAAKAQGKG